MSSTAKDERRAFSIAEFCAAYRISRPSLYNYWNRGCGPAYMKVGARRLISVEAAAAWRARMEQPASNAA